MTEREHNRGEGPEPLDEEAAWAQIVAAYGEEPADPPELIGGAAGRGSDRDRDHGADEDDDTGRPGSRREGGHGGRHGDDEDAYEGGDEGGDEDGDEDGTPAGGPAGDGDPPVRSFTVFPAGSGPRDWSLAEPSDDDLGEEDEGHFVPPEPPPLPKGDTTSRFAWLAVLGGPLLLLLAVLFRQDVTWWIATLGVGGFLGGFATLVARMRDDDDDDFDDPGRGAVV